MWTMSMTLSLRSSPGGVFLCGVSFVAVTSLCILVSTSTTEGSLQDQYIGCYHDMTSQSTWLEGIIDSNVMFVELCVAVCKFRNTTYAILQNGRNCKCGDVVDVSSPNYACDTRCSGNDDQICGGPSGIVSYYAIYSVCPIGYYGTGCDKACHCKQQIPCNYVSGLCPNGCDGNWTLLSCNREMSQSLSDRYIGCFNDKINRALPYRMDFFLTSTIEICSSFCASNYFTFAGIENHHECYCGEDYSKYGKSPDGSCNYACGGDVNQICGAWFFLSVYFACPIGYFGNGCTSRCNCKNEQRCTCANCTCSSGCKSGWMGSRCEFRNCLDNNGNCSVNETCVTDPKFAPTNRCICKQGYQKNRLWETCTVAAIGECSPATCDLATTTCIETSGIVICDCQPGYERIGLNDTSCTVIPSDPCSGVQRSLSGNLGQVYSVGVVVGVAVGSAAGAAVIFAIILIVVIVCRRQRMEREQCDVANQIQHKDGTYETPRDPMPWRDYETLGENPNQIDSSYTALDQLTHQ